MDSSPPPPAAGDPPFAARIAGLPVLKGLILYGASLTFAGFYAYFMEEIVSAKSGSPPGLSGVLIGAAAALAGVLGSGFALAIGVPTGADQVNKALAAEVRKNPSGFHKAVVGLRKLFSFEPADDNRASMPLTFGIWTYAIVASAVAIVYFVHSAETPDAIRALAIAFAGYIVAFLHTAYGNASKTS
jgi:hypothetical protein